MARNSDRFRRVGRDWPSNRRLNDLRRRLYRASDGKVLGVFKGIADSLGYSVCATRLVGGFVLISLAGAMGAHGLKVMVLVAGFFYLLTALLMQPPRHEGVAGSSEAPRRSSGPPPIPTHSQPYYNRPRVDLAQLDRQLDGLNRRIQRMETIVTDREYEWNRRMES